jgi:CubicO group peptidase (beta-lactamase class C family)
MKVLAIVLMCIFSLSFVNYSQERFKTELSAYVSSQFSDDEPGGALLIAKAGKVIFEKAVGLADIKTKEKITPDTVFNTGSISKTFVANGILLLHEQNKLSINDCIANYFNDFKKPNLAKSIKIIHFLSHTSGIMDSRKKDENPVFYLTAKDKENFEPIKENDSLLFNPGEQFDYSNPAYNGLALIIEEVTKEKWQDFVKETIFIPAGMEKSTITDGAHPESDVSHGYIKKGKDFIEHDYGEVPTFCAAGNGGVWSTVRELFKYEQALQKGKIISKDLFVQSRTIFKPKNWQHGTPSIGYSWFIHHDVSPAFVGHTGSQGGFISDYVYIPEKKIFYVLLCNTPKPIEKIRKKIFKLLKKYKYIPWLSDNCEYGVIAAKNGTFTGQYPGQLLYGKGKK